MKIDCLLCGNDAKLQNNECPGYQKPDTFKIYHCSNCNTSFSLPRINDSKVYDYIYKNGPLVPGYDRYWKYAKKVKTESNPLNFLAKSEETYWGVNEALKQIVSNKEDKSILEIGSGLGYLTYSLKQANYNVVGLDISQTAIDQANATFGNYYVCADLL